MKRLIATSLALVALSVGAAGRVVVSASTSLTANSTSAPSTNPSPVKADGFNSSTLAGAIRLNAGAGYRVTICAANGNTLSGAGTIPVYYFPDAAGSLGKWSRNPGLDETIAVGATSCNGSPCQCETFADHAAAVPGGFIYLAPNGITLSAGTTVTVSVEVVQQI